MAKDLVCGMNVNESTAKHISEYAGTKYYFCSNGCKIQFEKNPEMFTKQEKPNTGMNHGQVTIELPPRADEMKSPDEEATYYCPMHPFITSDKPGECPECGMNLDKMPPQTHEHRQGHGSHTLKDFQKRFWISVALTTPVLLLSPMFQMLVGLERLSFPGSGVVVFILSTIIFIYGGYPFLTGLRGEVKQKNPGMMTLIGVAITVAYVYSSMIVFGLSGMDFYWELATLIDIMLLGHWIEMRSVLGASRALEELARLLPSHAHLVQHGEQIVDVPITTLKHHDKVLIKPGEKIPADGKVLKGATSVNESMLTGESMPVEKHEGDNIIGGSINGEGSLTVEITKTGKETYIAQVIDLVKKAQESKSKTQDLANRFALYLTFIALSVGTITFAAWLMYGESFAFALERSVTVMVTTCPHALGLAIPLVVAISTALSARNGFLVRNRIAFEKAKDITAIVFDKTGTLTEGIFGVTDSIAFESNENELLEIAASLESHSEHSIAKGIIRMAKEKGILLHSVDRFKAIAGKGVEGVVNGSLCRVVSPNYLAELLATYKNEDADRLISQGKTVAFVLKENQVLGVLALSDLIRKESKDAIQLLKLQGIKTIMLTGDNRFVAKYVADELGIDEFFAEVLPHQKSEKLKEIQSRGLSVAMVGDGVNDAPALVQADVGIAIGAGTEVAIESADIILVRNDPRDVVTLLTLARKTYQKMVQNLFWAAGYNAIAIPLAAGVLYSSGIVLSPAAGAIIMSASTIIVAINAKMLRL